MREEERPDPIRELSGGAPPDPWQASLGFVIDEPDPEAAGRLCDAIVRSAPARVRVELLLLDDHLNPRRRELVDVVDGHGDSVRLVPRPASGPCERLDAASLSSCSEFLVVPMGTTPPLSALAEASRQLFADGADVVTIVSDPVAVDLPAGESPDPDLLERGLPDECDLLAGHFGLVAADPVGRDRVVLVRRWVARWLFSEVDRGVDPALEIADRARLLGLRTLVLDGVGAPVG